jgi:hypothetical protein
MKKKKKIEPDSIIDLFPMEEEETDLSWMIDRVRISANTNNKKEKKIKLNKLKRKLVG